MKERIKKIGIVLSFVIVILLLWSGINVQKQKQQEFEALNIKTQNRAETTPSRVSEAVVTLPDGNLIVGLHDNVAEYISKYVSGKSTVIIQSTLLKTKFVPGIFKIKAAPRLDAVVPMFVNADSKGGSLYVVLFHDRGDVALEKSYVRLGGPAVTVNEISFLPSDGKIKEEEYITHITFTTKEGVAKELFIPVVDGHFDPTGTVSK